MSIHIVPADDRHPGKQEFITSDRCDQLAMMLLDWKGNTYTNYVQVLDEEQIAIIQATYGAETEPVQECNETFRPNIVSADLLQALLSRIRDRVIFPILKEEIAKSDQHAVRLCLDDLKAVSECIGALEVMKTEIEKVYVTVEVF